LADFPEAVVLKGRNNYKCDLYPYLMADSCVDKCKDYENGDIPCGYYDQKAKLLASDFRILNTHYILFEMNFSGQLSRQDLIVIDEADTLDLNFIGFVSLKVSDSQIKKYNLGTPMITKVESWIEWAGKAIVKLKKNYSEKGRYRNGKKYKVNQPLDPEFVKAVKLRKRLELFLNLVQDDWIYNRFPSYSEFKPVWITKDLIEQYLLRHTKRLFLCSASLPPKEVFCSTLEIESSECDYIEVGSSFKPENRRVYYEPVVDMSYKNRDKYYLMMEAIEKVLAKYPDVKGIIHCQSYALGKQIMEIGNDRLLNHDAENKNERLKIFKESTRPLVFVSPSCVRGISLNDDLARFGICPKMPFPTTEDKAISARLYGSGRKGKLWYNSEAGQAVLQMSGRHVRSHTDYGDMWILDSCFSRVRKTLPDWYTKEIIIDLDYDSDYDEPAGVVATPDPTPPSQVVSTSLYDDPYDYI
jgi:hypothetical protein